MHHCLDTLSGAIPNRWCASIISKALFSIVAESIVIFAPILQFGCLRASAAVADAIRSAGHVRKGPPEAVMSRRSTVSVFFADETLSNRRMFGIDRKKTRATFRQKCIYELTGHHKSLLVCQRYILVSLYGAHCRRKAAVAYSSGKHHIDLRQIHAVGKSRSSAAVAIPRGARASRKAGSRVSSAITARAGLCTRASSI